MDRVQKYLKLIDTRSAYKYAKDREEGDCTLLKKLAEMLIIVKNIELRIIASKQIIRYSIVMHIQTFRIKYFELTDVLLNGIKKNC